MQIKLFVTGPFEVNSYVVFEKSSLKGFVVDPGQSPENIIHFIKNNDIDIRFIVNTHGHVDHIQGNAEISREFNIPIYIGRHDAAMLEDPVLNLSSFLSEPVYSPPAKRLLDDKDEIKLSNFSFQVLHTPGHTAGSISLYKKDALICGDVLFLNSIGRTDFPGSDNETLINSINNKIMVLPQTTEVYPGHGPLTSVAREKKYNPFLR